MSEVVVVTSDVVEVVEVANNPITIEVTTVESVVELSNLRGPQGATGPGVPPGGNTGQFLVKASNDDFDTEWDSLTAILAYTHHQASASATWIVEHNLGWFPNVTVIDTSGNTVAGDIVYDSSNQLTLQFAAAFAGTAHLS